jgi:two-component system NtrC family response regulator/two-component system nitrogen regulation response regulator GlnG
MSGIEFLGALQKRGVRVPVILMTGESTTDTAIQATNLGAFDYVIKPEDYDALFQELQGPIDEVLKITQAPSVVPIKDEEVPDPPSGPLLLGKSKPMIEVYKQIGRFAKSDAAVLILGESGTGKDVVARAIHTNSARQSKPYVALNVTALNENMLESELFGHEKNAFTGADKLRKGRFEYADGGTIFLDEIGDLPLKLQPKLLRVLENQQFERMGSNEALRVNVRIISATNRDLKAAVAEGKFREDLYFRIHRLTIRLPPLRQREADLELLTRFFLARAAKDMGEPIPPLSEGALTKLRAHTWPGNVRELQNVICRAVGMCCGSPIMPNHLDLGASAGSGGTAEDNDTAAIDSLRRAIQWAWKQEETKLYPLLNDLLERELLRFALAELDGNQTQVAERLGLARGTVIDRLRRHGLK